MATTQWWKYLSELMGEDTATNAAKKTGISASNFTRWKQGANADPDFVVKVARAYGVNVLEALVAAEFITDEEAALTTIAPTLDLSQVDAQELIDELQHRVDIIKHLLSLEEGSDRKLAATIEHRSNVVNFQSARPDTPMGAVADSSDYHDEENTEFDD